jgi:hypothetical protein
MLKIHRALMTIHMIGQNPKAAPSRALSVAWPTGIPYTASATMIATTRVIRDAHWALRRNTPSSRNRMSRGNAAKIDVSPSDWDTGSSTYYPAAARSKPVTRRLLG